MIMKKLNKTKLQDFIAYLQKTYNVYAPVRSGSETEYGIINSAEDIDNSRLNTTLNPKEIFFPRCEVLFSYDKNGIKTPPKEEKPSAVWGLRTCDTKSIRMLDEVFSNAHQTPEKEMFHDPYWIEKYKDCLLISSACLQPLSTCFCNWFKSGPFDENGSDIFVVETDEHYFLNAVTDRGIKVLNGFKELESTTEDDTKLIAELKQKAESYMPKTHDISGLKEKLDKIWDSDIWETIAAKCINCGACAYICPTCHCFDISDEGKENKGKRIRLWDACMFPIFTKEASGHNPREESKKRVRQRVMHKYNYFVDNYHEYLCTGCGRCVQVCPVNLDIRKIIKEILEYENKEGGKNE